jgi:mannose/cellobiose epimerase-like protein (N-acyl-D-glucosamine 2-epimerase family)
MTGAFFTDARARYQTSNIATLDWMLRRPRLQGVYLNTKLNPLTLVDYGPQDGWRGPHHVYGWIQGRGLESVVTHAQALATREPTLSSALGHAGLTLSDALDRLRAEDGHAYFAYDRAMQPIRFDADGKPVPQDRPADIFTYADTFVAKGLIAASAVNDRSALPRHVAALEAVIAAIDEGRFQMDEKVALSHAAIASEIDDFGPRMIMLGAAGMLVRAGLADVAQRFAERFIAHVIDRHFDPRTGLLRNAPGLDPCNVGHAIEFVGFALDYLPADCDPALLDVLQTILVSSVELGLKGPAIRLVVSADTGAPLSPYCPWWSLPETIRSAALVYERTGDARVLAIWKQADTIFFDRYWRPEAGIAYQCLTEDGPIDYVPATPDLDPGYHTGLSLLAAIDMIEREPGVLQTE